MVNPRYEVKRVYQCRSMNGARDVMASPAHLEIRVRFRPQAKTSGRSRLGEPMQALADLLMGQIFNPPAGTKRVSSPE